MEPYHFEPLESTGRRYGALPPSHGLWAQLAATGLGGLGLLLVLACGLRMRLGPVAAIGGWSAALLLTAWWPHRPTWIWWVLLVTGTTQFIFTISLCFGIDARGDVSFLVVLLLLAFASLVQAVDSVHALRGIPDDPLQEIRGFEVQPPTSESDRLK